MSLPIDLVATTPTGGGVLRRVVAAVLAISAASVVHATVPLTQISPTVYQTEHCLFIIDSSVTWSVTGGGSMPKLSHAEGA